MKEVQKKQEISREDAILLERLAIRRLKELFKKTPPPWEWLKPVELVRNVEPGKPPVSEHEWSRKDWNHK